MPGIGPKAAKAAPVAAAILLARAPAAWAADGSFLNDIANAFDTSGQIIWAVYYGLISLVFGLFLFKALREIIPAMLKGKDERPQFREHMGTLGVAAAVFVLAFLAPVWAPALVSLFGGDTSYLSMGTKS